VGALFDGDRVHIDCFLCNEGKIRRDRAGSPAPLRSPRLDGDGDERAEPRPRAPDAAAATARISRGATAELIAGLARVDGGQGEQRDVRRRSPSVPGRTTRPASFPATSRQRLNTLYAPLRKLRYVRSARMAGRSIRAPGFRTALCGRAR